jgi:hypothetical protein
MIIGICGLIGSGKGTVADILIDYHDFKKVSFADKLKDGVSAVFGWDRSLLEGDTDRSRIWREKEDAFWSNELDRSITPRLVLQLFGTDCMRNGFDPDIWMSLVKKELLDNPKQNYVIPDVRFQNEMQMIKSVGGKIIQARRGALPDWFLSFRDYGFLPDPEIHESEYMWIGPDCDFDTIIYNDGGLSQLEQTVKDQVIHHLSPMVDSV